MKQLPIEVEIAFVNQIEAAASNWRDDVTDYKDFRRSLRNHCRNIFNAGWHLRVNEYKCPVCSYHKSLTRGI